MLNPVTVPETRRAFTGNSVDQADAHVAAEPASVAVTPIGDIHSSAEYRRHLLRRRAPQRWWRPGLHERLRARQRAGVAVVKSPPFKYLRAESPEEAVSALAQLGDAAKVLAGGQSLLAMMNLRLARPDVLVDVGACGLSGITVDGTLEIGATRASGPCFPTSGI